MIRIELDGRDAYDHDMPATLIIEIEPGHQQASVRASAENIEIPKEEILQALALLVHSFP